MGRILARVGGALLAIGIVLAVWDMFVEATPATSTGEGTGAQTATVRMRDFVFQPPAVVVVGGRRVRIVLDDQGIHPHTFTVDGLGVDVTVQPGTSRTITVDGPPRGQFTFICRFHQNIGMRGFIRFGPSSDSGGALP